MAHAHHDHSHSDGHARHNLVRETTPTQTKGLQESYRIEVERRFRKLRGVLRETIDANDALRLRSDRANADRVHATDDISPRDAFPFRQRAMKEVAFQNQLDTWLRQGVLQVVPEDELASGNHWSGTYVRSAYREGIRYADGLLGDRGEAVSDQPISAAFNAPIHTRQLESLYTRNFEALEGITEDLDRTLSRVLTRGLLDGENPRTIANRLTKETRSMQRTRARTLARTETLRAHNAAAGKRYQEMGVEYVEVLTHDPCPVCQTIEAGNPYPVSEAHRLVPARSHPNCVCSVAPLI